MSQTAFVGTYTERETSSGTRSDGIYHLDVKFDDPARLERTGVTTVDDNPTYLSRHPDGPFLYAVHEVPSGGATAFHIVTGEDGPRLESLGRVESGAGGPCHCRVHPSGDYLFVAHYTGAAVSVLPIGPDGALDEPNQVVDHEGVSRNPEWQSQAHPHSAEPHPDGRHVYVPDLGTDEVVVYTFDADVGRLDHVAAVETAGGAGPRHMAFHPDGETAYVLNQLDSTLVTYNRDSRTGDLTERDVQSTLPESFDGDNHAADVQVHPSGDWLYASNRGHDSIAVFGIEGDGMPESSGIFSTEGEWPRHFCLDPSDDAFYVENMHTDEVVGFRVDDQTSALESTEAAVAVPRPSCLVFAD